MHTGYQYINGEWKVGEGAVLISRNPADGSMLWEGRDASSEQIDHALLAARAAMPAWASLPLKKRCAMLESYGRELDSRAEEIASVISRETGKPLWESRLEVRAMIGKIGISKRAQEERRSPKQSESGAARNRLRYHPLGVAAIFGPFNLPGHLPNGHIVAALLAGNTILFKPSEYTPLTAVIMTECFEEVGFPPGVINLIHGGRESGITLAGKKVDAIFFTGSYETGVAIHRAMAGRPEVMLALEMGGNNPLVVFEVEDAKAAAYITLESAFITSGQRCTCARRLILPTGSEGDDIITHLLTASGKMGVGFWNEEPQPFMGPVVSPAAADRLLAFQDELAGRGGRILLTMERVSSSPSLLRPGIMDVTDVKNRPDRESFGPFLQVIRVPDFAAAIKEANNTSFGLAAGLLSDNPEMYEQLLKDTRVGIINWNRKLTGASASMPFGGVGCSGNHRPAAYFAADYCSYPSASIEISRLRFPEVLSPGLNA